MDSHVWRTVYQMIKVVDRSIPRSGRKPTYTDALMVSMYLWSVGHDRPLCWACRGEHYTSCFRPRKLPSGSQFCRRIQTPRCHRILQEVYNRLAETGLATEVSRLEAVRAWEGVAGYVYRDRIAVERYFAHQSAFGGGLAPLPPWVRTLPRVRRWIGAKLIIYHVRRTLRKAVS